MPADVLTFRPDLAQVTLVAVTSVALEATMKALHASAGQARFGAVKLLSDRKPDGFPEHFDWAGIEPLRSRSDYSLFMQHRLTDHIETSHALVVQWDGYVLDGRCWRDGFLEYDYIGAPWPQFDDGHAVGNGGFSLRSKRLLDATRLLPQSPAEAEDTLICRTHRALLETRHGIRFASTDTALEFAYERTPKRGGEFGFHGVFNMMMDMPQRDFEAVLASLEPGLLGRREGREVMWHGLRRARLRTLLLAVRQRRIG
jgi:hypothetical protein